MLALAISSIATVTGAFTWTHIFRDITFVTHNSTKKLTLKLSLASGKSVGVLQIF